MEKENVKNLIEDLENLGGYPEISEISKIFNNYDEINQDYDLYYHMSEYGIVDWDTMDDMCQSNGFARNVYFLASVNHTNDEYYYIDGYGNASNLDYDTIKLFRDETIDNLKNDYEIDDDEEGETKEC